MIFEIKTQTALKFIIDGIRSCKKIGVSAEDVLAHDIAIWELEYVYISLIRNHGEYRFFKKF